MPVNKHPDCGKPFQVFHQHSVLLKAAPAEHLSLPASAGERNCFFFLVNSAQTENAQLAPVLI